MAPSPQDSDVVGHDPSKETHSKPLTGEEVVISGMSGIFPSSDSVTEFADNLYKKVDMVDDQNPRWDFVHPEVPKHLGKVRGMDKFDAQFFRVHYKQGVTMEPMSRKLLEHAYSAIYDSGVNPEQLRGKKIGVFIGAIYSESERKVIYENVHRSGFGITGCNKSMLANRISYWIDGKGPSFGLDVACAGSMACIDYAYRSISTGQCDAAIVGGCNLCRHPGFAFHYRRFGLSCLDGKTKSFDKNGDGSVRSEAISIIFLQKAKDAKRIYSQVYHCKAKYNKDMIKEFKPIREAKVIQEFLEEFYSEIDVSPKEVEYVEGFGCAIAKSDVNELEAIGRVFGKEKPVKVGSVMSNMGNSEPASGVCSVTKYLKLFTSTLEDSFKSLKWQGHDININGKYLRFAADIVIMAESLEVLGGMLDDPIEVCLAYHKGAIPGNLHYYEPPDHISAIRDGKVEVLTDSTPFNRGFTALNSFSYTGVSVHVLLKGWYKPKNLKRYESCIPRLVIASGRQDSCVETILDALKNQPIDPEQIGLLHNIHQYTIPGHMSRGYVLLDSDEQNETVCLSQNVNYWSGEQKPIWFVYSGMGSQWATMGADLMRIPTFAAAIQRCQRALDPKGINIIKILTEPDKNIFNNILNSFVGIAAVQIGLTDVLKELGIVPDNIIGHSVGELGCAYADGCFTAEEMILSAYSRGLVSVQTPFIKGSMAAVGLSYENVLPLLPPELEVACHNSAESSTISGPEDVMKIFVTDLSSRGIFAKEVPCSNIAYHSRYIAEAGPGLLKYLSEVIKDPKPRSEKWVSTSVPQENWEDPKAKYSSAEYHTNNLLNSVLFEETARLIPKNAIIIEIAPHGLLQAILKRSHPECVHIPLTRRGAAKPVEFFLGAIGSMYIEGLNPKVENLYPKIEYPVATETPMLSHLVQWVHGESWPEAYYYVTDKVMTMCRNFIMSIHDEYYNYLEGHVRDDIIVFPEAGLLVLVWETLAMYKGVNYRNLSVIFENIHFYEEVQILPEELNRLSIMVHKGNGAFEVNQNGVSIVTGFISLDLSKNARNAFRDLKQSEESIENEVTLTSEDVYKIMHLRGYCYQDKFRSIQSSNLNRTKASIKWDDEWVTFIDSIIQFTNFARDTDAVSLPKVITKLTIDTELHGNIIESMDKPYNLHAEQYKLFRVTRCGGVEIENMTFQDKTKTELKPDVIQTKMFIPHHFTGDVDLETAILANLQLIAENVSNNNVKIIEIVSNITKHLVDAIKHVESKVLEMNFEIQAVHPDKGVFDDVQRMENIDVFVVNDILGNENSMKNLYNALSKNAFVISLEQDVSTLKLKQKLFTVITSMSVQQKNLVLFKKSEENSEKAAYVSIQHDNTFLWLPQVINKLQYSRKLVLVSERQTYCGLLGLVKKLRKEFPYKVSLIVIDDKDIASFDPDETVFSEQLKKNLTVNILKKGHWGGYYYLPNRKSVLVQEAGLRVSSVGDIDSLSWNEILPSASLNTIKKIALKVHFAGPSFRDIEKVIGKVESDCCKLGMDFSGVSNKGERIMGLIPGGAIASTVQADPDLFWPVPEHWTLEEAATVPLPYVHALYCLGRNHRILKSQSIFVHSGTGALGQAVINLCLAIGCKVYTSVSSVQKKRFLMKLFPQLPEQNIACHQSETFIQQILIETKGHGCDFVINTLSGPLREASCKLVGKCGIVLDVNDTDMRANKDFGMAYLQKERNYIAINLANLFKPEYKKDRQELQLLFSEVIAKGYVRPLSRVVYPPNDVNKAFRLVSTGNHIGRVLINMKDPISFHQGLNIKPSRSYLPNKTYIVVCDRNEIGVEILEHLVKNGAKKLLIHIKSQPVSAYIQAKLMYLRKQNIVVNISYDNLETQKDCANLLENSSKISQIDGIFIIQDNNDCFTESYNKDLFATQFKNTAMIVANLDITSRNICPELSYFVVFSQSSNSAADEYITSVCEKICQSREDVGLPSLIYRIQMFDEFGCNKDSNEKMRCQSISNILITLDISLKTKLTNVISYNIKKTNKNEREYYILEKITKILGFKHIDDVPKNLTLKNLNINELGIEELKAAFKEATNTLYSSKGIMELTISEVKKLCNVKKETTKFDAGLGAFFTFIDKDELLAGENMIAMPTKLKNNISEGLEEEIDSKGTYLMLIPGFEGHYSKLLPISERLEVLAMTFQLMPDMVARDIPEIAADIMQSIKKRCESKSKFYLLGYSFGVNIALELAALFEKEGRTGVVYCLDSSPDALRVQLDAYIGDLNEVELQDSIIKHMYKLMSGQESQELFEDLKRTEEWNDKIEACVSRLRNRVNYSNQYKKFIIQQAYDRIKLARLYNPTFKLESELILIKGIPHPKARPLPYDYNLSQYSKQKVQIFELQSDHALAPNDCRVSDIVNRMIDPKLREHFKNTNLCDTHVPQAKKGY